MLLFYCHHTFKDKINWEKDLYPRKVVKIMACKRTSKSVASKASKALRDGRTSATTKSIAGSALSQRQPKHTHKKK